MRLGLQPHNIGGMRQSGCRDEGPSLGLMVGRVEAMWEQGLETSGPQDEGCDAEVEVNARPSWDLRFVYDAKLSLIHI